MNVLGVIGFGQNPGACLLQDGKMIAFAEEERFTRLKGSDGMFPANAVAYCLKEAKLTLNDIEKIAFGWNSKKYPWTMLSNFGSNYLKHKIRSRSSFHKDKAKDYSSMVTALETLMEFHPDLVRSKSYEALRIAGLSGDVPEIIFKDHHLSHAYSSYFCSGFEKAGIITIDGSGENICTQLSIGEGDRVKVVESYPIPHSLGWFYAAITQYLGFVAYRDEGKLMGLAAFGEERAKNNKWVEPLSKILKIKNDSYEVDPIYTKFGGHYYGSRFTDELVKLLTSIDPNATPILYGEKAEVNGIIQGKYTLPTYIDIAWAAQDLLEKAALTLAKKLVSKYNVENICIAGGVGLNCKMNGEILRKSGAKNIFVQPASNDAGTALGAAMIVSQELGANIRNPIKNTYLGPGFSNDSIKKELVNSKLSFTEVSDPASEAAKLLNEGKIVSWFQGRMEYGARALGNRSILANPIYPNMKDKVNVEVKYREPWRPFCPSMTIEAANDYIVNPNEASYMIVAYHVQQKMKEKLSAVVHVDDTIRPQAVTKEANPLYHSLIDNLGKLSGHPVVMNTSFNVRGEPIICTPLEAIRAFYSNGLDALVIGNFLLKK